MRSESHAVISFPAAALLLSLAAPAALAQDADWRSFGPPGGNVLALAVDPHDSSIVYAGARGGAFKSTAGGAGWRNVGAGLGTSIVTHLVVDPTDPSTLYASALTPPRFYRSRDAGETWEAVAPDLFRQAPRTVIVDPDDGSRVWVVLGGIYRSLDGGETWEEAYPRLPGTPGAFAIALSDPDRLYAAGAFSQVYRSADGGETWQRAGLGSDRVATLIVDPDDADVVFAHARDCGGRACIYRTLDAGRSWSVVASRPFTAAEYFVQLLGDPRGTGTLYLVTSQRILRSADRGTTWTPFGQPVPELPTRLAIAGDGTVYLATRCGVFRAAANGGWQAASGRLRATEVRALAVDPTNPGIVFAGTRQCGQLRSVDGGVRWLRLAAPGASRNTLDLALDPASPATRWYAATHGGLFRTTDGGASWRRSDLDTGGLPSAAEGQVAVAASDPRVVYAVHSNRLFRSLDRGETFSRIDLEAQLPARKRHLNVHAVAIDPTDAATVYAAQSSRLLKSTDGGRSWRHVGGDLGGLSLVIDPGAPATLYAVARRRPFQGPFKVHKSDDGGGTWREVHAGLPDGVRLVAIDPAAPATLYAGSARDGVWVSRDGAGTWQPLADTRPTSFVRSLTATGTAVYAGTYRGVQELPRSCGEELAPAGEPIVLGAGTSPDVAVDGAGRFVAAWTAPDGTALARAVDAHGRPVAAAFRLDGRFPAVAADGPGEVVAIWSQGSAPANELRARVYSVGGEPRGGSRRVDREPRRVKLAPAVARTRAGESVVVWESVLDPQRTLIRAQRLDARGVAAGKPFTVRGDADRVFAPAVSADAFGRFTVVWLEVRAQQLSVRVRSYRHTGAPRSAVVRVSGEGVVEAAPAVAMAPTDEVVVGWLEGGELVLRWLEPSGAPAGEQRLDAGTAGFDVDVDRFGNTLAVWTGGGGIRARIFDAAGGPKSAEAALGEGGSPAAAYDLAGRAVVVWEDGGGHVVARRLRLACALPGR